MVNKRNQLLCVLVFISTSLWAQEKVDPIITLEEMRGLQAFGGSFNLDESACVEGNCIDGKGTKIFIKGNLLTGARRSAYVGEFKNGKFHGKGAYIFYWEDKDKWLRKSEGDFVDGQLHGKGIKYAIDLKEYADYNNEPRWKPILFDCKDCDYHGDFVKGEFNGYGTLYDSESKKLYEGGWIGGKPRRGPSKTFYAETGSIYRLVDEHNRVSYFKRDGSFNYSYAYVDKIKTYYNEEGIVIRKYKGEYEWEFYHPNGKPKYEGKYYENDGGIISGFKALNLRDQFRLNKQFLNTKIYDENGNVVLNDNTNIAETVLRNLSRRIRDGERYDGNGSFSYEPYVYKYEYKLTNIKGGVGFKLKGNITKNGSLVKEVSIKDYLFEAKNRPLLYPSLNPFALMRDMIFNDQKEWILLNETFK